MEGDEIEMSEEELQRWIRAEVHKSKLISPDVLEKCYMLQSLLQRREKRAAQLLKLCESVAACEAIVRQQYSLLGWEYVDTHSDNADANITDRGPSTQSICESIHSETQDNHSSTTNEPPACIQTLQYSENLDGNKGKTSSFGLKRNPVVVLTRLPESKISVVHPSAPKKNCSENKSPSSLDSEMDWEPEHGSRDSDYSHIKTGSKKMRKTDEKNKKTAKGEATPQVDSNIDAKSNALETSTSLVKSTRNAKKSTAKASPPKASTDRNAKTSGSKTSVPEASRKDKAVSKETKASSTAKNKNDLVCISTLCQADETAEKASPRVPQGEICVNMSVLARRRETVWQQGQIKEIHTKDDGRVKYKVFFENKGKSLVSGHHIAFDCMPKLEHLFVGARVVFKHPDDNLQFCPGILAEVPSRKNRMRFLIFTDDHKPFYVGLPLLHLVYKPLPDPLDDIVDETHRNFMKEYLEKWPYPPQTQYKVGQMINAELNGALARCEVQVVDCSLIQVMFQSEQHKDWIYRGSMRLEHMLNMRHCLTSTKTASR